MIKQFIITLITGRIHQENCASEDAARFICEGLFPGIEIVSIHEAT